MQWNVCKYQRFFLDYFYSFITSAKDQADVLSGMQKKMESLYKEMGKFYAFDYKKYGFEEFFQDIKAFRDSFSVSSNVSSVLEKKFELRIRRLDCRQSLKMCQSKSSFDQP